MANKNTDLHKAKKRKKDEFYTQLSDIERELKHYKNHFKGKIVYCNCDDPRISNFFHYFSYNFEKLGLKKLITTCYKNQDMDLFSQNESEQAIYLEYNGDKNGNFVPDPEEIGIIELNGDGDFRSLESIELLNQADIVVTNPPFSLFREYVGQLIDNDKKFIIIGHQNAITYKEIFKYIKENKMWLGYGFKRNMAHFINPHYEDYATDTDHKEGMIRVSGVVWYTNLEIRKRHEDVILYKKYYGNEDYYPKYDNYDAINVDKAKEIPMDYEETMGVPITFLSKYNPDQFELIGQMVTTKIDELNHGYPYINGKKIYARILIRNKKVQS
ncbi:adenine-specific methyltransferase EcoRI family protein [Croceivirga sp. JEA036]|uniref:adenine-specific methyltransferase EcoRI family protein n=1 Tax=Croceivirga sp. JEA036 TaxID=2721162 RepID=UPI00143C1E2D|nr:adenine-specific methyltransferase EcoRI family protein [Croceivirga sp. JEA036]NJB38128.1 modification methylase [Croceivirga sp. JEA036]